jgi:hypothetical protein
MRPRPARGGDSTLDDSAQQVKSSRPRAERIEKFVAVLARGEGVHPPNSKVAT